MVFEHLTVAAASFLWPFINLTISHIDIAFNAFFEILQKNLNVAGAGVSVKTVSCVFPSGASIFTRMLECVQTLCAA